MSMDMQAIATLLHIEEKTRNLPNLKAINQSVILQLEDHAKEIAEELKEELADRKAKAEEAVRAKVEAEAKRIKAEADKEAEALKKDEPIRRAESAGVTPRVLPTNPVEQPEERRV